MFSFSFCHFPGKGKAEPLPGLPGLRQGPLRSRDMSEPRCLLSRNAKVFFNFTGENRSTAGFSRDRTEPGLARPGPGTLWHFLQFDCDQVPANPWPQRVGRRSATSRFSCNFCNLSAILSNIFTWSYTKNWEILWKHNAPASGLQKLAEANRHVFQHVFQNCLLHAMLRQLSNWQILEEKYRVWKWHGHVNSWHSSWEDTWGY